MAPVWEDAELPVIKPFIPDRQYLESEHLLVAVRSQDNDESYGAILAIIHSSLSFLASSISFSLSLLIFRSGECST